MKNGKKRVGIYLAIVLLAISVMGCEAKESSEDNTELSADNVIITEAGETLIKQQPTEKPEATDTPAVEEWGELPAPDVVPEVEISEPEQEQVITEEDQTSPTGSELQIVFLGDSIFDNK